MINIIFYIPNKYNILMKIIKSLVIIVLVVISKQKQGPTPRGFLFTPKAVDLEDHFGTIPADNLYGPHPNRILDIPREFDTVDGNRLITPISNLNELDVNTILHGDLNNTAYDASRIIKPEYAVPKVQIDSTYIHNAEINTPVQTGNQVQTKLITSFDSVTGAIDKKEITTSKPIITVMKNIRQVETPHTTYVNLLNGKTIDPYQKKAYHGI